jgi:hypothetical protein
MPRLLIAPISFGLGDLVVSLPAVQAVVAEGHRIGAEAWLVARSTSQRRLAPRIRGLDGCVDESALELRAGDRLLDLRDHPMQRDAWWGSAAFENSFGPLDINEIIGCICRDLGIDADFASPVPLEAHPRSELGNSVLFVHESDGASKTWPDERWSAVAVELRAAGLDVRRITRGKPPAEPPGDRLGSADIPALLAPTPGEAVDVLSSCAAVIGVDTGLTHIAAQQGTPTVTICRTNSVYFRPWPHCRVVRGGRCTDECDAAETQYAYNEQVSLRDFEPGPHSCPSGAPCLTTCTPRRVLDLVWDLL